MHNEAHGFKKTGDHMEQMPTFEYLSIEKNEGAFIITLDRPEARNAINSAMWAELCDAFELFDDDDEAKVAILTNTGKVFCAGADLKEYNEKTLHPPKGRETWGTGAMTRKLWKKPIILAANGKVVGGGAEMLLAADLAILTDDGMVPSLKQRAGYSPVTEALPSASVVRSISSMPWSFCSRAHRSMQLPLFNGGWQIVPYLRQN